MNDTERGHTALESDRSVVVEQTIDGLLDSMV
jgi:hypothetical protein